MATEMFAEGGKEIAITITPGDAGVLQLIMDGEMVYDKKAEDGQTPNLSRVKQMRAVLRDKLASTLVAADD
jgi:predicted Rdx family selenoprotein